MIWKMISIFNVLIHHSLDIVPKLKKHGLSYIILFCIQTKEWLYLLIPLQHQNFHIDQCVVEKMNRLKTFANWTTIVPQLKNFYHLHVIIQALNTNSLWQHYQDINHDHNLQVSHVLCILQTRIQSSNDVQNFINIKIFIHFKLWWSWFDNDVQRTKVFTFLLHNNM